MVIPNPEYWTALVGVGLSPSWRLLTLPGKTRSPGTSLSLRLLPVLPLILPTRLERSILPRSHQPRTIPRDNVRGPAVPWRASVQAQHSNTFRPLDVYND